MKTTLYRRMSSVNPVGIVVKGGSAVIAATERALLSPFSSLLGYKVNTALFETNSSNSNKKTIN